MRFVETQQSYCRIGLATADITPPLEMHHRMWGAALHDRATSVHRPLRATALFLRSLNSDPGEAQLVLMLDHCVLEAAEIDRIRGEVCRRTILTREQVQVSPSHTHGAGLLLRSRAELPGGDLIGPYLDSLAQQCGELAVAAIERARPATVIYGTGRCNLAAHRDYWDGELDAFVCGFNPTGPSDDTVVVARMTTDQGVLLGTIINYACHPTTLAWQNTAISPDFIGAMREVVERETGAPCMFIQGALGDLGPREGFVGDSKIADRNGRQLGFAALSTLESLPPDKTHFVYSGPVLSGTPLGTWCHETLSPLQLEQQAKWKSHRFIVSLSYRNDLPNVEQTKKQLSDWRTREQHAAATGDDVQFGEARARAEQLTRELSRLSSLTTGATYPCPVTIMQVGGALWVFIPGEPYQIFQTSLRARFPDVAIIITTLTEDGRLGYLPEATTYGRGIYQERISLLAPGSLELLIARVSEEIGQILQPQETRGTVLADARSNCRAPHFDIPREDAAGVQKIVGLID